jgi:hypothetical protein
LAVVVLIRTVVLHLRRIVRCVGGDLFDSSWAEVVWCKAIWEGL